MSQLRLCVGHCYREYKGTHRLHKLLLPDLLLQLTRNLKLRLQNFSSDKKRWQFILNWRATWTQWPEDLRIQQWCLLHLLPEKKNTNRESIMNRKTRWYTFFLSRPFFFHFVLPLKRGTECPGTRCPEQKQLPRTQTEISMDIPIEGPSRPFRNNRELKKRRRQGKSLIKGEIIFCQRNSQISRSLTFRTPTALKTCPD